eukprot:TRINITY_DN6245_c0_g1_i3.p1 TRINITY_DN6245_c0_g1~~TRINITY_DN6245_c0_g1_i3.p1  ORF type:complete len:117 (+),score=12.97 TRINITY_DN6245_c0_g1_i3:1192-1542(+)
MMRKRRFFRSTAQVNVTAGALQSAVISDRTARLSSVVIYACISTLLLAVRTPQSHCRVPPSPTMFGSVSQPSTQTPCTPPAQSSRWPPLLPKSCLPPRHHPHQTQLSAVIIDVSTQ